MSHTTRRAAIAVAALLFVPWTVLVYTSGHVTLVFPWGLATPTQMHATTLYDFLFRYTADLPGYILAWPIGTLCYVLAVVSALVGLRTGREDVRVTAGLLVCAGLTQLSVAHGFSLQPDRFAVPVGTMACLFVAWWFYLPLIRADR